MNDEQYVQKYLNRAYKINKRFFGFDIKYKIKLLYTRKEMDRKWGNKTPKWLSAGAKKDGLYIFAPSVFEKLTTHKLSIYQNVLLHEMCHLFYEKLVGTYKPFWLSEGIAMNLEVRGYKYKGKINKEFLFYIYKDKEFNKHAKEFYRNSYLITKKLINKMGGKELLFLLKKFSKKPTRSNYNKIFGEYLDEFSK